MAWLSAHPERTEEWLAERLKDGFQVHHIDGNHENDDPLNLVLIESGDHMMLHNGGGRLLWKPKRPKKKKQEFTNKIEPLDLKIEKLMKKREWLARKERRMKARAIGKAQHAAMQQERGFI